MLSIKTGDCCASRSTGKQLLAALAVVLVSCWAAQVYAAARLDPDLEPYHQVRGVAGSFSSAGSDSMANLVSLWAERFMRYYSGVTFQVKAAGSSTAPPALAEGTANIGPMSRLMEAQEQQAFELRHGYPATPVVIAIDALAVFVHKDNPVQGLTLQQLDGIFSSNRNCSNGAGQAIENWGQLALPQPWQRRSIQVFGRNSVAGPYDFFKSRALCGGDFGKTVNEQPGSASVVQSVGTTINAIGYSGMGYRTASVRAVPISENGKYYAASAENAVAGLYPLSRYLYIYLNKPPGAALPAIEREFIRFVLSWQGQRIVLKDGFIPLPATLAEQQKLALGL
jgi:phosphate transport system substrate-binding protein